MTVHRYVKKGFKIALWAIGIVIVFFLLLILSVQVPAVQDALKSKAVAYLEGKIHTKVSLGKIEIGLPKKIILEDVYLESQDGDTLLAGKKIAVDISLFKLFKSEVEINSVVLKNITANVIRDKDSVFNFDYIIDAFASKQSTSSNKQMKISVHDIYLENIKVHFKDAVTKNNLELSLIHFDTRIKSFDLPKMYFDVPKVNLDGLVLKLKKGRLIDEIATKVVVKADSISNSRPDFNVNLGEISLSRIKVNYQDEGGNLNSGLSLEKLFVSFGAINLPKQKIDINKIEISGVNGKLKLGKYKSPVVVNVPTSKNTSKWKVTIENTNLDKINFQFDDDNIIPLTKGIDYNHLNIQQLQLQAEKLNYSATSISGRVKSFAVKEKSGLIVSSLKTNFNYNPRGLKLNQLYLKTPHTLVRKSIEVSYGSLESLKTNMGLLDIDVNLKQSKIGFKDILLFAPNLIQTPIFKNHANAIVNINGSVKGQLKDLNIPKLEINGIGGFSMAISGKIIGLPNVNKAWYNLNIQKLEIGATDIKQSVEANVIPKNITLPKQMALKGTLKGSIDNLDLNLLLNSSFGAAKIKTTFDYRKKDVERYNGTLGLKDFNIGQLINNQAIGNVSLNVKVKGIGLNPRTATATITGKLDKGTFNKYTYRNLNLKGEIANGRYNALADMNNPDLEFDLVSNGNFTDVHPKINLKLNVEFADLEKLNLHAGPLKVRGNIDAAIATADLDYLNGKITAHNLFIVNDKEQINVDSITISAVSTAHKNSLQIQSQFLKASMKGQYQLNQVMASISNSIARYYKIKPAIKNYSGKPQHFNFAINIKNDPILKKIVPEVKQLEPITINGRYNSENDTIVLNANLPRLVYGTNTITKAFVNMNTNDNVLSFKSGVDEVKNEQFRVFNSLLEGTLKDNILAYKLQLRDEKKKDKYIVAGTMKTVGGNTDFHVLPEDLLLNYEPWVISNNNSIKYGSKGLYILDFELNKDASKLILKSTNNELNAPLNILFSDFDIATISNIIQTETMAVDGKLNGIIEFKNNKNKPVFTAALTIDDLLFKKQNIGNFNLKINNKLENLYTINASITGKNNQVELKGVYRTDDSNFDIDLNVEQLNIATIEPFAQNQITKSSGYVSGKFNIKGNADIPKIIGDLQFHDGAFTVKKLNTAFELLNDKLSFTNEGILFEKFSLSDSDNNILKIRGKIATQTYRDFAFNLKVDADNFKVSNSTAKDNDLYYGKLFIDTHIRVKGDMNKPVIDGNLKVNKNTELTILLPQSDPSIVDREGVVEFIDEDAPKIDKRFEIESDSLSQSSFKGVNVSVAIEVDKEAELTLIIDKANGDFLKLKGEAQLIGGIDESGKTTLTGRYELKKGVYEMTFNFLKRKFEIEEGSYILWTGEPTSANINITAVYKSQTAPLDLLDKQLGDVSATIRNTYKQKLPFETLLKMNGELLKPEISFDIRLPEGNYNVSSEIVNTTRTKLAQLRQQPDELNKQVFALLLLNRFIGENPFASETGTGTESLARQSVSKILSQQLNNLAGDLVKGVEVDFDLESSDDYTTGTKENRTDLNVGLSKQLLNDRLKVTVGSSFGIEGTEQANRSASNIAGNVSLNYKLSKDGRYMLRVYRKNDYQVALQGEVVETGVAFTIVMDYNKFRELFHRSEEEKEMKNSEKVKRTKLEKKKQKSKDAKK